MTERKRRLVVAIIVLVVSGSAALYDSIKNRDDSPAVQSANTSQAQSSPAAQALEKLEVKGKAPKTGYARDQFSDGWGDVANCDVRNYILSRDMSAVITRSESDCTVMQGRLEDPYTGKTIFFVKGSETSDDVQIDHVVALSNAWQTGAQQISPDNRYLLANDPLNLLAVDGPSNQKKGDSDAATWLPANKDFRCRYVARQVAVKAKYLLWVTEAEKEAMKRVLAECPDQVLPVEKP